MYALGDRAEQALHSAANRAAAATERQLDREVHAALDADADAGGRGADASLDAGVLREAPEGAGRVLRELLFTQEMFCKNM